MKIKVFYPNREGNVEFTKQQLEELLEEAYNEGYKDGKTNNIWTTWTSSTPSITLGGNQTLDGSKYNDYTIYTNASSPTVDVNKYTTTVASNDSAPVTFTVTNN